MTLAMWGGLAGNSRSGRDKWWELPEENEVGQLPAAMKLDPLAPAWKAEGSPRLLPVAVVSSTESPVICGLCCKRSPTGNRDKARIPQRLSKMSTRAYILASDFPQRCVEIIQKHFNITPMEEFLKNKEVLGNKIQVIFVWDCHPKIDETLLKSLPRLKAVVNGGVGVDHFDLPLIFSFGVKVTNTPHVVDAATADMGMALLLASARNVVEGQRIVTSPDTKTYPLDWNGVDVTGATLGIIGMGRIGYKVAQRARGFDMKILYHNRNRRAEEEERPVNACYCAKIDHLLQESDFVMLVVNLNPQTHKLIGEREFGLMKSTATLTNISRGAVIDQDALVQALQKGCIRAAALDVTDPEPLPRDHPLLQLSNVILTPHIGTATDQTNSKMVERMIENALAAIHGLPVPDEVLP